MGDKDYRIGSNFWKFYLISIGFTLGEPVFLVNVFKLFRLEPIFLVLRVWTQYVDVQYLIYWQGQRVCGAFDECSLNSQIHLQCREVLSMYMLST